VNVAIDFPKNAFVDGKWERAGGESIDVINPATEEAIASLPSANEADVDHVLSAAQRAQRDWGRQPGGVRGEYVRGIGRVIRENADPIAELIAREVGKPLKAAHGELAFAANYADYMAGWDRRIEGEIIQSDNASETIHLLRVPLGVVAAITAWNFPIALFVRKVAPALVAGNAVVVKPTEIAPLSTLLLMRLIDQELGLPPGVLNVITGAGATGQALTCNARTNMVTFTGHRDTGKRVMADASANLTRVALELGGKAPAIVWRDADITLAVEALAAARFGNSGQICTCVERALVHESVFDEFVTRYVAAAAALRLGDPMTDVDLGPLASRPQYEKALKAVARAKEEGARVAFGGERPLGAEFDRGYWVQPTVVIDVKRGMDIMRQEVFGPVIPIAPISSYDEAFSIANDSRYGLSAYVFTSDYKTAMRAAQDLDFGELYINRANGEQVQAHHTGHKESGLGGEDGKHGVLRYTQIRSVYHSYA
jgi:lactaldehyde dehydrogenase / glycolaldehyde dehydrogenase